jgi:ribosomal protein S14
LGGERGLKMKKLLEKDRKIRKTLKNFEKKKFLLKMISNNSNLSNLIRFNALYNLNKIPNKASKTFVSNRCVSTINKKKFNKLTRFSRMVFLKMARNKEIYALKKSSW